MVPRLRAEGGAVRLAPGLVDPAEEPDLGRDDRGKDQERPPLGQALRIADLGHGVPPDPDAGPEDYEGGQEPGDGVRLAVPVGMVLVGGPGGPLEPRPDQH